MFKKNEVGITLIELLLTLSITVTIGILIWSVFFQGFNYSNKAMTNNQLQQEANIIINGLAKYHRNFEVNLEEDSNSELNSYMVKSSNCKISISAVPPNTTEVFQHPQLCFKANITDDENNGTESTIIIHPDAKDVSLTIKVSGTDDQNSNSIIIDTVLSRLKRGDIDEENY
ncbi:hypothetical protein EKG37_19220 [Robertmurraya yapensis]|uniref:Prepilin-type N-terminal cleavage/methylation domain-containing protein n=1 Tax=Bacillus yapensis TaxID=2492960 RepID=A0A3S0I4N3_9BACI|nr:hypothetical protein [Bacillus yapensis]RTR27329.1 hypothetical protein EKG37_19220 [Bacillus yapensis]TKS94049.1 hypothetical protein FAR12_19225 [Bacillus yapensis]